MSDRDRTARPRLRKLTFLIKIAAAAIALLAITLTIVWRYLLITTVELRPNIYLLTATIGSTQLGANVLAVDTDAGWVLIDTQLAIFATPVSVALRRITDQPVHTTINTHWHPDHTGGNKTLGEGAERIAHERTRRWMTTPQAATGLTSPDSQHQFAGLGPDSAPTTVFSDHRLLSVGQQSFRLSHPGAAHTGGDTVVEIVGGDITHVGDILWPGGFTFADTEHGGSVRGTIETLDLLAASGSDETLFVSGHGPPLATGDLRSHVARLREAFEYVAASGTDIDAAARLPAEVATLETALIPAWRWAAMITAE